MTVICFSTFKQADRMHAVHLYFTPTLSYFICGWGFIVGWGLDFFLLFWVFLCFFSWVSFEQVSYSLNLVTLQRILELFTSCVLA